MKKILCLLTACLLTLIAAVPAMALEQSDAYYVTDETGYLSQDTVDEVTRVGEALEAGYGGCVVVAFIDYFGDAYADEYTVALFNDWSLSNRSMLLCVSPKEGRGGMTVGSELTDVFTEDDINNYLDRYFWNDFDKGNYDKAVTRLVGKLSDWYENHYGPASTGGAAPTPSQGESVSGAGVAAGVGIFGLILGFVFRNFFVILFFVIVLWAVISSDRRRYRGYYMSIGMPIPRYRPWYMFSNRPYRRYRPAPPPPPPGNHGGGYRYNSSSSRPSYRPSSRPGGHSGGSFGGRGGGHSGGGRSGGSFGGRR